MLSAAKSYGLEIDDLFKLGGDLKENGLSVEDCNVGLLIAAVIARLGFDLTRFEDFVKNVFLEAMNQGISDEELAKTLTEFSILRNENGRGYRQANENYQELLANKQRLEAEVLDLENRRKALKRQLDDEIIEVKTTREELRNFTFTRDTLSEINVPVENYEKLPRLFQNVKDLGYKPEAVVNLFSSTGDLLKQEKDLTDRVEDLTDQKA